MLIDTKQFRLVDSAGLENYAALSYVWGKQTFLKTTTANLERLRKQGSLQPTSVEGSQLATTVRDAMLLAPNLGILYLWTDMLCVVQDDEDFFNVHLNSMATIDTNAT